MVTSNQTTEKYTEYIAFKSLFYFCSLPLRLDSYRGCTFGCLYCFSQQLNNRKPEGFKKVIPADPEKFKKLMDTYSNGKTSLIKSCLRKKIPIHFGCVSDPFQPLELSKRITRDFLKVLANNNYPTVISTKSNLITDQEYITLLKDIPSSIQISFSTFNDELAKRIEPNSPTPSNRLKNIEKLSMQNFFTVARIQPFLFPIEKLNHRIFNRLSSVGVKHVILEHLRIPTNSSDELRERLWKGLGKNILECYRELGIKVSRINYELNSQAKYENILLARELSHQFGMSFGAGDNDYHHYSDSICCCGIPETTEFSNYYKGHLGYSAYKGVRSGNLEFSNLDSEWQPDGSIREYLNSDCRIKGIKSVEELLRYKINNPSSSNSPSNFFGIEYNKNKYSIQQRIHNDFLE